MREAFVIAAGLALLLSSPLMAAEVGGVKLADKAAVAGKELVLNGAGIRTKVVFKVYQAVEIPIDTAARVSEHGDIDRREVSRRCVEPTATTRACSRR